MTHHHHHHHDVKSDLTFEDKLIKLLEHWLKHNADHAGTYREWSEKARTNNLSQVADLLEQVSTMSVDLDDKFREALAIIQHKH
jgi:hypothetical protein